MENKNQETLLRVDHLCQYFGATKAVDDVSLCMLPHFHVE